MFGILSSWELEYGYHRIKASARGGFRPFKHRLLRCAR